MFAAAFEPGAAGLPKPERLRLAIEDFYARSTRREHPQGEWLAGPPVAGQGHRDVLRVAPQSAERGAELGQITTELGQITTELSQITTELSQITTGLGQITTGLGQITTGLGQITTGLGQITTELGQITTGLGQITTELSQITTELGQITTELSLLPGSEHFSSPHGSIGPCVIPRTVCVSPAGRASWRC